jgi:hypothetical protein
MFYVYRKAIKQIKKRKENESKLKRFCSVKEGILVMLIIYDMLKYTF